MATTSLPPGLESRVAEGARKQGMTPEALALDTLRQAFTPVEYYREKFPQGKGRYTTPLRISSASSRVEGNCVPAT